MTKEELLAMEPDALKAHAESLGLKVHHKAGAEKIADMVLEAEALAYAKDESVSDAVKVVNKAQKPTVETYTYVGKGPEIPEVCNFMGLQRFIQGEETEVTNPVVLAKIKNHPCFVKGAADKVKMFNDKQAEIERVERQRQRDRELQNSEVHRNGKFK